MIAPNVLAMPARVDVILVKAVSRAFRWRRLLEDGSYNTIKELPAAEKINASYLCRVLRQTLLAPTLVEAILDGRQGEEVTLPFLMEGVAVVEWLVQNIALRSPRLNDARQLCPCPSS